MPHTRIAMSFAALLLGASALSPAQAGWFDFGSSKSDSDKPAAKNDDKKAPAAAPAKDLDGAIREAQLLRVDGHYDEAIKDLSQIMLVAADDPRVINEYGKTLAAMGRASEAVDFLTRAQQLSPNDWSVYSALGVAYDQTGNQQKAAAAYEHALALKPGEASVLNNYALSRMLAKDTAGAHQLIARAEASGGGTDPKIARNIAMLKDLTPAPSEPAHAVAMQAPPQTAPGPVAAPRVAVASHPIQQVAQSQPFVNLPQPSMGAPRPLVANNAVVIQAAPQQLMPQQQPVGVVMQRVPVDPLAGPVAPRHVAAAISSPTKASAEAKAKAPVKTAMQTPAAQANALEAKAEAIAKQLTNKPAAQAQAMAAAGMPAPGTPKPAETKPVVKAADAAPKAPAKVADAKPAPVKTADAKPAAKAPDTKAAPIKTATKDAVPALRVSASAY